MSLAHALLHRLASRLPTWITDPAKQALVKARLFDYGDLPPDFIGSRRVRIKHLPEVYGSTFPDAGPKPWLDRPDAQQSIEARQSAGQGHLGIGRAWP